MKLTHCFGTLFIAVTLLSSCSSEVKEEIEEITVNQDDIGSSFNSNFDGKIFSIPSPILTMLLIKKVSPVFHPDLLHSTSGVDHYQTEYSRALTLGIYGADLGYVSIYKNKAKILDYLGAVEKLTGSLGLDASFSKSFVERYQKNADNSDSMINIVSDAFKNADLFLKNSDRKSVSALILTGGWIESMHFAASLMEKQKSSELLERIGEQKQTLITLISLLEEYNKQSANNELIDLFKELNLLFKDIEVNYEYEVPETKTEQNLTVLKHSVSYKIEEKILQAIKEKIRIIRQQITE